MAERRGARLVAAAIALCLACALGWLGWLAWPSRPWAAVPSDIAAYVSDHDEDGDGVDDQSDILASARAYVATGPAYGSAYYAAGRPNDGRGVCTDVVDQALLGAGYDLRHLMDDDIRAEPSAYGIDEPDPNIDFRRVVNQRVWFSRHALSLACDLLDPAEWQGGDVVCWGNHVGIVSDRRTGQGIPLVIHHYSASQLGYEQDVLASDRFGPIVGHFRMS